MSETPQHIAEMVPNVAATEADSVAAKRLAPATLLLRAPQLLRSLVNGVPLLAILYAKGNLGWMLAAAVFLLLVGWVWLLCYWLRFSFRIGADEISIDSGILSRTHRVIPFDRVQDVSIEQNIVARLLGLAKVRLETGASAGAGQEEGELNAIKLSDAEALRDRIRNWRAVNQAAARPATTGQDEAVEDITDTAPGRIIFAMPLRRVLINGLFGFSLALFAVIFGALQMFGDMFPVDPLRPSQWMKQLDRDNPLLAYLLAHQYLSVALLFAIVAIIGVASGIVTSLFKQYGFKLERTPSGLRRQRGLTTRTDVVIPVKRVQAAMIVSGWLPQRFGWYGLKLQSLASDGAKESDHDVAPLAHLDEIDTILAETSPRQWLGRSAPDATGWHGVHPAMWRYGALAALPMMGVVAVAALLIPKIWPKLPYQFPLWLLVPLFGWYMLARYWRWSRHRYRLELAGTAPVKLEITHGWWKPRHLILPVRNIQSVDIDYGPLYRLAGLANVQLGVAGQNGLSAYSIGALPLATAHALRAKLIA